MARYRGTFTVAANYEPLKAAPFDARMLVEAKADLTLVSTWQQSNGDLWIYNGMIVAVGSDVNAANNGVYVLLDASNYTEESSWQKLADTASIDNLQEQIDNIDISGGSGLSDIEVATEADLPEIGTSGVTYYVLENNSIYRWQEETQSYISFGGSADLDINIINGGNANGNTD